MSRDRHIGRVSIEGRTTNEPSIAVPVASAFGSDAQKVQDQTAADPEKGQNDTEDDSDDNNVDRTKEALDTAWGKHGKVWMWIGIALMWTIFELDHTTIYNYQNYAASEFKEIALLGALMTAGTIISAVLKPPIAKISDVVGRAETYVAVVIFFIISYVLCASANGFGQYAGGFVVYCIGQTGMQILNQIIVADITSSRWRGLANGLVNLPFMIIPWASAFIVDSALVTIGWRWGIGMFAIIMPACSIAVVIPLISFQRRYKKAGGVVRKKTSFKGFVSQIDLGGIVLFTAGCAMLLLPIALAGNTSGSWDAPWVPTLITLGALVLAGLVYYEARIAKHPLIPPRFIKNVSLMLAFSIGLLDSFAYSVTHTYMYAWATVVHEFSARDATFLTYTAGCVQVLTGLGTGFLMYRSRRYKWLLLIGIVVRLVGYGFMMRLRGANNSVAEIFLMQVIQGAGSGAVGTVVIVVAQVVVPRTELSQATALELLCIYMGTSLGSAISGTIYTSLFKQRLRFWMGDGTPQADIDRVYQTITDAVTLPGTNARDAVNHAYSDILRYMTIAALVASAVPMVMVWFLPNLELSDDHNLAGNLNDKEEGEGEEDDSAQKTRWQRFLRKIRW